MSNEVITVLLAMLPVLEIRGALPVAIGVFEITAVKAFWLSVFGNVLPVLPLLFFWRYSTNFLIKNFDVCRRFFDWLFAMTRRRYEEKVGRYGVLGLLVLVAIPLPITGAWTATVAAYIFGISFDKAFFAILLGVMIAGLVVLSLTYGVISISGI